MRAINDSKLFVDILFYISSFLQIMVRLYPFIPAHKLSRRVKTRLLIVTPLDRLWITSLAISLSLSFSIPPEAWSFPLYKRGTLAEWGGHMTRSMSFLVAGLICFPENTVIATFSIQILDGIRMAFSSICDYHFLTLLWCSDVISSAIVIHLLLKFPLPSTKSLPNRLMVITRLYLPSPRWLIPPLTFHYSPSIFSLSSVRPSQRAR